MVLYAWPSAEIAVMGPEAAVNVIHRRRLAESENPDTERVELTEEYRDAFANPYQAAARGYVDDVIEPHRTRPMLIQALELLRSKRDTNLPRKHGNIPL